MISSAVDGASEHGSWQSRHVSHARDPGAPPHWRWQAAVAVIKKSGRPHPHDDPATRVAIAYLNQSAGRETRASEEPFSFATVAEAHSLFSRRDLLRAELDARLVAGQTDSEISLRCNIPEQTVACYAALFFAVRDYLVATDWILSQVVGSGPQRGFRDDELREFWCWAALAGGPLILDSLIEAYRGVRQPARPETLSAYLGEDSGIRLDLQAYVAAAVLPPVGCPPTETAALWIELKLASEARSMNPEAIRKAGVQAARAVLAGDERGFERVVQLCRDATRAGVKARTEVAKPRRPPARGPDRERRATSPDLERADRGEQSKPSLQTAAHAELDGRTP